MNATAYSVHSYAFHVAIVSAVSIAALSFLALVVLMIIFKNARQRQAVVRPRVRGRIIVGLAAATGLLAPLPIVLASGAHTIASLLVHELIYASVTTLGFLACAAMIAGIATGEIQPGGDESHEACRVGHGHLFRINPASGLPMNGALDMAGNSYGEDFHSHLRTSRTYPE